MEQRVTRLETQMEAHTEALKQVSQQVAELNESLARYRGAWGMLLMIGTAITGAVTIWFKVK